MTQDETTKEKPEVKKSGYLVVTAEEFLPELRETNPEAKWKEAVEHLYDKYGGINNIQVITRKGESKFIVNLGGSND